jgi:hypothetical protein
MSSNSRPYLTYSNSSVSSTVIRLTLLFSYMRN